VGLAPQFFKSSAAVNLQILYCCYKITTVASRSKILQNSGNSKPEKEKK
jgi:hypothetical protein